MKRTFFVGTDKKHKIDLHFSITGKERIYVDEILVCDIRNFSLFKASNNFKAGEHDVKIEMKGNIKGWSLKVFVDDTLYIEELNDEELKKIWTYSRKFYMFLAIILVLALLYEFLKGFYQGMTGAG